jgi:hypothetical protein
MTKRITTYEELMLEKHRLKLLLHGQKELIHQDINEIKDQLLPVKSAISFIGKLTTKDSSNPLLRGTMNTVIDLFVRKVLLARAGWFMKLVVPLFLKNYTSHVIDEKKDTIINKVFSWFGGKKRENANWKMHHIEEEEED